MLFHQVDFPMALPFHLPRLFFVEPSKQKQNRITAASEILIRKYFLKKMENIQGTA